MSIPVVAPSRLQAFATKAYWQNGLAAAMAAVYPGGPLTGLVDVVEDGWAGAALPTGCASITRYTVTNPGGRSGGTPSYTHLLRPSATSLNKVIVFLCGHGGWDYYCDSSEANVLPQFLAAGYMVLAIELPNYGHQPQPQSVFYGGRVWTQADSGITHFPGVVGLGGGGPSLIRLFFDHAILSMNQITRDLGVTRFALMGHSGGGSLAATLAPLEPRFAVVHYLQGWYYNTEQVGDYTHEEMWTGNDVFVALGWVQYRMAVIFGAAFAGRKAVLHDDGYWVGDQSAIWMNWAESANIWLRMAGMPGDFSFRRKLTPIHSIDDAQVQFVIQHLQENL